MATEKLTIPVPDGPPRLTRTRHAPHSQFYGNSFAHTRFSGEHPEEYHTFERALAEHVIPPYKEIDEKSSSQTNRDYYNVAVKEYSGDIHVVQARIAFDEWISRSTPSHVFVYRRASV